MTEHFVEGLVHVSTLVDDFYRFDEAARCCSASGRSGCSASATRSGCGCCAWTWTAGRWSSASRKCSRRYGAADARAARGRPQPGPGRTARRRPAAGAAPAGRQARAERDEAGTPLMRTVVVGTAGHIDHGKSALVRALTGTDPDRLKEEKARGITIELGFAHAPVGRGRRGVVRRRARPRALRARDAVGRRRHRPRAARRRRRRVRHAADARALRHLPPARRRPRPGRR